MSDNSSNRRPAILVSNSWTDKRTQIILLLRSYRSKVANYQACVECYESMFPSCVQQFSDMPIHHSDSFEPERWAIRRESQAERMKKSLEDMRQSYVNIESLINSLTGNHQTVLMRRYILNESYEAISEKMHCHRNTVKNWHDMAIRTLVKHCDALCISGEYY